MSKFLVRKAAVLGAGVMGAQIAAHLANAGVQPVLFELAAEGRDKNANVRKALDGPREARAQPARDEGRRRAHHARQLRRAPGAPRGVRPRDRGHQRAHGLEEVPLRQGGAAPRAARDLRLQHLGPVDHGALEGAAGGAPPALLRHPLLQPAALHAPGGDHPDGLDRPGHRGRPRGLPHDDPGQGRGARPRHAQLRGQPRGRLLDARDDAPHARLQAGLRRGGRAHRARRSGAPRAPPSAPRTSWAWTRWRTW